jgi:hypothetical protein
LAGNSGTYECIQEFICLKPFKVANNQSTLFILPVILVIEFAHENNCSLLFAIKDHGLGVILGRSSSQVMEDPLCKHQILKEEETLRSKPRVFPQNKRKAGAVETQPLGKGTEGKWQIVGII